MGSYLPGSRQSAPGFSIRGKKPPANYKIDRTHKIGARVVAGYMCDKNGVLRDITGNGHDGARTGTPSLKSFPRYGRALDFSGSDYYVVPHSDKLNFTGGFSVATGVISDNATQNTEVVEKQTGGSNYYQLFNSSAGVWGWYVGGGGFTANINGAAGSAVAGEYANLLGVSSDVVDNVLYKNGVNIGSDATAITAVEPTDDLRLCNGNAGTFNGKVFYVWIIKGALTQKDAKELNDDPYCILEPIFTPGLFVADSGVSGTLDVTLADATSTAAGNLNNRGTTDATLADATSTAAGNLNNRGTADNTLADATSTAAGNLNNRGTADSTLADATSTAAGNLNNRGTLDVALADATSTAVGNVGAATITGTLDVTLADATSTGAGNLNNRGTADNTLADATSTAAGLVGDAITGTVNVTLADTTSTATGNLNNRGTADNTLADATSTATGEVGQIVAGTLDVTLADATATGVGTLTINGSLDVNLADAVSSATGFVGDGVLGTLDVTLADATASAFGIVGDFPPAKMFRVTVPQRVFRVTVPQRVFS